MATVFVGLSGGVDSAVSAALLKEAGHRVVGCFIKIWQPEFIECTWREDRLDAIRVCATLQIPYKEIDLSEEYKKEVISDMVSGYQEGRTPNPDVLCNGKIKFGSFAQWAFENGADYVATGHYARSEMRDGTHRLLRGIDREKDQSYFLWQIPPEYLAHTLFPIGGYTKSQVRALAAARNLSVAKKHDSQGLCFVGNITLPEFLSHYISLTRGAVLDDGGVTVGEHEGAALYTLGQRHGFSYTHSREPQYVFAIDVNANTISISSDKTKATRTQILCRRPQWIGPSPAPFFSSDVQTRYREKPIRAKTEYNSEARVTFSEPHLAMNGQSIVWYEGDVVLGGGILNV